MCAVRRGNAPVRAIVVSGVRPSSSSVLRVRDVRLLVGAVGLSALGDVLLWVLLAVHVAGTVESAWAVSALFVCLWAPVVLLGGAAGRLVDRHENRRLLIVVSLAQAAVVAAMVTVTGSPGALLVLCGLLGAGAAVSAPAEFALLPAAAGERRVAEANGHVEAARYLGMTAGPLLGGALAGAGLIQVGLIVDAASFLAVAAAGVLLRARRTPDATAHATAAAARGVRAGLAPFAADRTLAIAFGAAVAALLFFTMTIAAEIFFVSDVLDAGPTTYGVLVAAWTLGMVIGAVGLARRVPRHALAVAALGGVALQGAGILGAALGATLALALVGYLVGGTAHGLKNVALRTLIHHRVPEALRGRAFAAYNSARNGAELVALAVGGALVGFAGAQPTLALAGAVPLALALVALLLISRRAPMTSRRMAHAHDAA
jgi:MFS family permease